ncbi:hypothetical protein D0544_01605 [Aestuariirhabdus litorea]|uniref:Uncharacterized protein n=2 Tax=Aestuariirhabdus litorea TaxID=2528527 RepID=A0A3P3VMJ2_9GAMM|nr:transporter substrate-binding domain-containing protein [Aestuariirhabdus litorea]RRJ83840.1 hypothetical protein D0544_01605 [Aestuariirhabdus litorea]
MISRRHFLQYTLLGAAGASFHSEADRLVQTLRFVGASKGHPISYLDDQQQVRGLLPELLYTLIEQVPEVNYQLSLHPWARAQALVKQGAADALCTYPSDERKEFAVFCRHPLFIWSYGYLVYRRQGPEAERLEAATSFEDLASLRMAAERGSSWETDNIPAFINRVYATSQETALHLILLRKTADFCVMNAIQASHYARKHGYQESMAIRPVEFIPNSKIPFHIGVKKDYPNLPTLLDRLDNAIMSPAYQEHREAIMTAQSSL